MMIAPLVGMRAKEASEYQRKALEGLFDGTLNLTLTLTPKPNCTYTGEAITCLRSKAFSEHLSQRRLEQATGVQAQP